MHNPALLSAEGLSPISAVAFPQLLQNVFLPFAADFFRCVAQKEASHGY